MLTINGIYKDGRIELSKDPGLKGESAVLVTFLSEQEKPADVPPGQMMTYGMLAVRGRRMSAEDDFKIAEYDDSGWDRD